MAKREDILSTSFSNSSEIHAFFKKYGFTDYPTFQKSFGITNPEGHALGKIPVANFNTFWTDVNIKKIFRKDSVNLAEMIALNMSICFETGAKYSPVTELGNMKYAFQAGAKASYNTKSDIGMITAYNLFNDADYIAKHSSKQPKNLIKTTNTAWQGTVYPAGFEAKYGAASQFIGNADFYKFRGRGLIQNTGRTNYKFLISSVQNYNGSNKNILYYKSAWSGKSDKYILTTSTNEDWDTLFNNTNLEIAVEAVRLYFTKSRDVSKIIIDPKAQETKLRKDIFDVGKSVNGGNKYANKLADNVLSLINDILKREKVEPIDNENNAVSSGNTSTPDEDVNSQSERPDNKDQQSPNKAPKGAGLVNQIKRSYDLKKMIVFDMSNMDSGNREETIKYLGYLPFIWYASYQIDPNQISSFVLRSDRFLPEIEMTFNDTGGLMSDINIPMDDSKIVVFINSRIDTLDPILMKFKIKNFKTDGAMTTIYGVADINYMLSKKTEYYNMSSYLALQEIAKKSKLGFNSNTNSSNDKMYWLNVGDSTETFVTDMIDHSYISDSSFVWSYVDYYYNINYVDIESALNLDLASQKFQYTSDLDTIQKGDDGVALTDFFLGNDEGLEDTNHYITDLKILNNSTEISIDKGYLTKIGFYGKNELEKNIFDVDTISSAGDKRIVLKGNPVDDEYYKTHIRNIYGGKVDTDNAHKNYIYANVQNDINIAEMQKIAITCKLPTPNYNIVRFQKVKLNLNTPVPSLSDSDINMVRLSGEWLVIDIKFVMTGQKFSQHLTLMRRDLSITEDEQKLINEQKQEQQNNPDAQNDNTTGEQVNDTVLESIDNVENPTENTDLDTVNPNTPAAENANSASNSPSIEVGLSISDSSITGISEKNTIMNNDGTIDTEASREQQNKENEINDIAKNKSIPLAKLNNALLAVAAIDYAMESYEDLKKVDLKKVPKDFKKNIDPFSNARYQAQARQNNGLVSKNKSATGTTVVSTATDDFKYTNTYETIGDMNSFVLGKTGKNLIDLFPNRLSKQEFDSINTNLDDIFGKNSFNLVETITLNEIISQNGLVTDNSNVNTLFALNNKSFGNKSSFELFNNETYIDTHIKTRNDLKYTTDMQWDSQFYPLRNENGTLLLQEVTSLDFFKLRKRGYTNFTGRKLYKAMFETLKYSLTKAESDSELLKPLKDFGFGVNSDVDTLLTKLTNAEMEQICGHTKVKVLMLNTILKQNGILGINTSRSEQDIFKSVQAVLNIMLPSEQRSKSFDNIVAILKMLNK